MLVAMRMVAWIEDARIDKFTPEQKEELRRQTGDAWMEVFQSVSEGLKGEAKIEVRLIPK